MGIIYKSASEIAKMRAANVVVRDVLAEIGRIVRPGITTGDIGELAAELVRKRGVIPSFLGYGHPPFPAVVCVSVNDEVVHGIPRHDRVINEGDIVSVDFGVEKEGYCGDAAQTFGVGQIGATAQRLMDATREALDLAIEACIVGNRIRDISAAVQRRVEAEGFSVVRDFVGHGIGRDMHEQPQIPNYVAGGSNPRLKPGMVLAIEPMVNEGTADIEIDANDHWTARTRDGKLSAHFEHSVAITERGPYVLSGA